MTAKQRVVLGALRDAQHEQDGQPSAPVRSPLCAPAPWQDRPNLVTQALRLLQAQVLSSSRRGVWVRHLSEEPDPATGRPTSPAWITRRLSCVNQFYDYGIGDAYLARDSGAPGWVPWLVGALDLRCNNPNSGLRVDILRIPALDADHAGEAVARIARSKLLLGTKQH